jgi:hypothetical protein
MQMLIALLIKETPVQKWEIQLLKKGEKYLRTIQCIRVQMENLVL